MYEKTVDYQVVDINEQHPTGTPWAVKITEGDNETTLISSPQVSAYFREKYGLFICPQMYTKFLVYNSFHVEDFKRALDAWNADYNPLDNYNGTTERITTDTHGDETKEHKTGGQGGTHNKVTQQALANTYTQHDTTTYDSTSLRAESKDTQNGGTETIDDLHTEDKTSHTEVSKTIGDTTVTGDIIHTESENKHGNLGVTTSQQMIMSEVDMRFNPIKAQYLDRFIYEFAYYAGGKWGFDYGY